MPFQPLQVPPWESILDLLMWKLYKPASVEGRAPR